MNLISSFHSIPAIDDMITTIDDRNQSGLELICISGWMMNTVQRQQTSKSAELLPTPTTEV